jgi:hypothetical protein
MTEIIADYEYRLQKKSYREYKEMHPDENP